MIHEEKLKYLTDREQEIVRQMQEVYLSFLHVGRGREAIGAGVIRDLVIQWMTQVDILLDSVGVPNDNPTGLDQAPQGGSLDSFPESDSMGF